MDAGIVTNENYFTRPIMAAYWSVSQFKDFMKCQAAALASVRGEYEREDTTALLVGSYVDAYFSGEMEEFRAKHPAIYNTRTGELKADYKKADEIIERVKAEPLMMEFLTGETQVIKTAELFGVPWKIKIDVLHPDKIVDLKVVKDFNPIYEEGHGRRSWVAYWGYDIQGAIYQEVERIASGRAEPLPFYLVAVTKEKVPDVAILQIPQPILDDALALVKHKIDELDLVKMGDIPATRCGHCDYCKRTKHITAPAVYDPDALEAII